MQLYIFMSVYYNTIKQPVDFFFFKSLQVKDLLQSSQIKFEVLELDQQGKKVKVKVDKAHM